jgi:hypothetical protein
MMLTQSKRSKTSSRLGKEAPLVKALRKNPTLSKQEARKLAAESIGWIYNLIVSDLKGRRQRFLTDLANCNEKDGATWFWKRWAAVLWPESLESLVELANDLRTIWRIDHTSAVEVTLATSSLSPEEDILNQWLMWRPTGMAAEAYSAARMRFYARARNRVTRGQPLSEFFASDPGGIKAGFIKAHEARIQRSMRIGYAPFSCSLQASQHRAGAPAGTLVPDPMNLRGMLIQGVFENWGHLKKCANSTCLAPYFIAKRKDQMVCEAGPCKAQRQREHSLKWWNENRAKKPKATQA